MTQLLKPSVSCCSNRPNHNVFRMVLCGTMIVPSYTNLLQPSVLRTASFILRMPPSARGVLILSKWSSPTLCLVEWLKLWHKASGNNGQSATQKTIRRHRLQLDSICRQSRHHKEQNVRTNTSFADHNIFIHDLSLCIFDEGFMTPWSLVFVKPWIRFTGKSRINVSGCLKIWFVRPGGQSVMQGVRKLVILSNSKMIWDFLA